MELVDTPKIDFGIQQKLSSDRLLFIHYQSTTTSSSSSPAVVGAIGAAATAKKATTEQQLEWREWLGGYRRMKIKKDYPIESIGRNTVDTIQQEMRS
mmetsp:Transcript_8859/g.9796  ORF Transcript_8859/g.9796 Transcript_8859/m.9796 type:complete len:97 (+) Transcript_8859:76-366(+)